MGGGSSRSARVVHKDGVQPTRAEVGEPTTASPRTLVGAPSAANPPHAELEADREVPSPPSLILREEPTPPLPVGRRLDRTAMLGKLPKAAVMLWRLKAWDGEQLRDIFFAMDTDSSRCVDKEELRASVHSMDFGAWQDTDVDELFEFLDVDKDTLISLDDFTTSVITPLLKEQVERGIRSDELGRVVCELLPMPRTWSDQGTLADPFAAIASLSKLELADLLRVGVDRIASHVWEALGPVREALEQTTAADPGPRNVNFKFAFVNVAAVEKGSLNEYLGLPAEDVNAAMADEHDSEEEWTTGNYGLTTSPKHEFEFIHSPDPDKVYPGEGGSNGRRRQSAEGAWRRLSSEVPVRELLKTFKGSFPTVTHSEIQAGLEALLGSHETEADKAKLPGQVSEMLYTILSRNSTGESYTKEESEAIGVDHRMSVALKGIGQKLYQRWWRDAVRPGTGFTLDTVNVSDGSESDDVYHNEFAALQRYMCNRLAKELERDANRLVELVSGWDLTMAEVEAIMLYTGPMFEHYNRVLRLLPRNPPYKNTILMLISGIMKLRQRTVLFHPRKAFRGLKGGELPPSWLLEDACGCKGGAEQACMSTSLDRSEAAKYAARGGNPTLLEIDLGQVDKGADVSSLSQYPAEKEILFAPMTNLEVLGLPRLELLHGRAVMVLSVRVNVSLKNQTREELDGKRKAVFIPTLHNTIQETEREVKAAMTSRAPVSSDLRARWEAGRQAKLLQFFLPMVMKPCHDMLGLYSDKSAAWFKRERNHRHAVLEAAALKQLAIARFTLLWDGHGPWRKRTVNRWHLTPLSVLHRDRSAELRAAWERARGAGSEERRRAAARAVIGWEGHAELEELDAAQDEGGRNRLMMAAVEGDVSMVQLLIDAGADASLRTKDLKSPLLLALESHPLNLDLLRAFAGAGVDTPDRQDMSPLQHAVLRGNLSAARALLEMGANSNCPSRKMPSQRYKKAAVEPRSLLQYAVATGSAELRALLCEFGARDLFAAVFLDSPDMVQACVASGADANEQRPVEGSGEGRVAPLHYAAIKNRLAAGKALVAHGATLTLRDGTDKHRTPLRVAIEAGSGEVQAWLLEAGAVDFDSAVLLGSADMVRRAAASGMSVDHQEPAGESALRFAAKSGTVEVAQALLDAKADPNLAQLGGEGENKGRGWQRTTALRVAVQARRQDMQELLVAAGARDLYSAVTLDNGDMVRACAQAGEDVNVVHWEPPLSLAAAGGKMAAVRALLESGAEVTPPPPTQQSSTQTPLQRAVAAKHFEVARVLRESGAADLKSAVLLDDREMVRACAAAGDDLDAHLYGTTALHEAAKHGAAEAAEALLECKADPRGGAGGAAGGSSQTPLDYAVSLQRPEIARLLFKYGAADIKAALALDDADMVRHCAAAGIDLEAPPSQPLFEAVRQSKAVAGKALVDCGVSLSSLDRGRTPLQTAALVKSPDMLQVLRAAGAADVFSAVVLDDVDMLQGCVASTSGLGEQVLLATLNEGTQVAPLASLLHAAVRHHSPKVVPALLAAGAIRDGVDEQGLSALQAAAVEVKTKPQPAFGFGLARQQPDPAAQEHELKAKADVVAALEAAEMADLYTAALLNKPDMVRACAARGHDVNEEWRAEWRGRGALQCAVKEGSVAAVRALLECGAKDCGGEQRKSALQCAVDAKDDTMLSVLREFGLADAHAAALLDDSEMVRVCAEAGSDLNTRDPDGKTALRLAAHANHANAVQALVQGGADVNAGNGDGVTALLEAAEGGHTEVVAVLVGAGAGDVASGAVLNDVAMVKRSIAEGAGVNEVVPQGGPSSGVSGGLWAMNFRGGNAPPVSNVENMAPLHRAAKHNSLEAAKALLEAGADAVLTPHWSVGEPHAVAAKHGHEEMRAMLLASKEEADSSEDEEGAEGAGGGEGYGSSSGSSISIGSNGNWEESDGGGDEKADSDAS